jgi:hypothetical protein
LAAALIESYAGDKGVVVAPSDVTAEVLYTVGLQYKVGQGTTITEATAQQAIATTNAVATASVAVTVSQNTGGRRLLVGAEKDIGRRLQSGATVSAVISFADPVAADSAQGNAGASTAGADFASAYATQSEVETGNVIQMPTVVAAPPVMDLQITYHIKAQTEIPSVQAIRASFQAQGGSLAAIASVITVTTPAPTQMPTSEPTPLPAGVTFTPTGQPTAAPPTPKPTGVPTHVPTP